jgi:hypothetical protein
MGFELERLTASSVIHAERTILCSLGASAVMCQNQSSRFVAKLAELQLEKSVGRLNSILGR